MLRRRNSGWGTKYITFTDRVPVALRRARVVTHVIELKRSKLGQLRTYFLCNKMEQSKSSQKAHKWNRANNHPPKTS